MSEYSARRGNGSFHAEEEREPSGHADRPDWKVRLQAATLFWVVSATLFGIGAKFLAGYISDTTDKQLATHTAVSTSELVSLGKDLYAQVGALDKRLAVIERNCIEFERWRGTVDSSVSALQDWRQRCSAKQSEIGEYIANDRENVRRIDGRIDSLHQMIDKKHP